MKIGLREANQEFSRLVRAIRAGQEVVLTDRGEAIDRSELSRRNECVHSGNFVCNDFGFSYADKRAATLTNNVSAASAAWQALRVPTTRPPIPMRQPWEWRQIAPRKPGLRPDPGHQLTDFSGRQVARGKTENTHPPGAPAGDAEQARCGSSISGDIASYRFSTLAMAPPRRRAGCGRSLPSNGRRYSRKAGVTSLPEGAMNASAITLVLPATLASFTKA